jgi:predicted transcriptional regulator
MDIVVVILKGIITINFFWALYFGVKNYKMTQSHSWLFLDMGLGTAFMLSLVRLVKEFFYTDFERYESTIVVLEVIKVNLIPFVTAFLLASAIAIGRERISAVIPIGKKEEVPPRCGIERGITYLAREETPKNGYQVFLDLLSKGYRGLLILRTHPDEVRKEYDINVPILWMSMLQVGNNAVYPNVAVIEQMIEEFLESRGDHVVLIERLDYLISQQGFDKTLQFIQKLSSLVYITKSVAIVHIDPLTIGERELMLIEKETKEFKEKPQELEEELAEMLLYIFEKNRRGRKPNLTEITQDLALSRNTAKKRMNILRLRNLIILKKKGREKVVEITRSGEDIVH